MKTRLGLSISLVLLYLCNSYSAIAGPGASKPVRRTSLAPEYRCALAIHLLNNDQEGRVGVVVHMDHKEYLDPESRVILRGTYGRGGATQEGYWLSGKRHSPRFIARQPKMPSWLKLCERCGPFEISKLAPGAPLLMAGKGSNTRHEGKESVVVGPDYVDADAFSAQLSQALLENIGRLPASAETWVKLREDARKVEFADLGVSDRIRPDYLRSLLDEATVSCRKLGLPAVNAALGKAAAEIHRIDPAIAAPARGKAPAASSSGSRGASSN